MLIRAGAQFKNILMVNILENAILFGRYLTKFKNINKIISIFEFC